MTAHPLSRSFDVRDPAQQRAIVTGIAAGDVRIFEAVFCALQPGLARMAARLTGSSAIGDEVVHDVFLKVWQTRATWQPGPNVTAHLYACLRNAALGVARRQALEARWAAPTDAKVSEAVSEVAAPDALLEARDVDDAVSRAIIALAPRAREAFLLRWREQLTYAEIAIVMGISVKTVEKQLGQALTVVRRALRPWRSKGL